MSDLRSIIAVATNPRNSKFHKNIPVFFFWLAFGGAEAVAAQIELHGIYIVITIFFIIYTRLAKVFIYIFRAQLKRIFMYTAYFPSPIPLSLSAATRDVCM